MSGRRGSGGGRGRSSESSPSPPRVPATVADGRFEIKHKIGSGSYSDVYLGREKKSGDQVAVKFEWMKAEKGRRLLHEAQLYESLASKDDVPCIRWWGSEGEHNIMVMDLLGPSLEDLFNTCGRAFSMKTVLMLAEQMIDRIEYVHSQGILHRDIKPHNFLMGLGAQSSRVFIMDFGLAKRYRNPETGEAHIPCLRKKGVTGTVRYTSLNVHHGFEPSRRDDLGAVGYVLMHFNRGKLPWQGIKAKSKRVKQRKIGRRKEQTSHEDLCKGFPQEFVEYLEYCDSLHFEGKPNYDYLRRLMRDVFVRGGFRRDLRFDWVKSDSNAQVPEATAADRGGQRKRPPSDAASRPRRCAEEGAPSAKVEDGGGARACQARNAAEEGDKRSRSLKRRRTQPNVADEAKEVEDEEEESDYEYDTDEEEEEEEEDEYESDEEESEEEKEEGVAEGDAPKPQPKDRD